MDSVNDRVPIWAKLLSVDPKALWVNDGARTLIVPKSQCEYDEATQTLHVARWLADKEKMGRTRLLVCGGRGFDDEVFLWDFLEKFQRAAVVMCGPAPGADTLAARWAEWHDVPLIRLPGDWEKYREKAALIPCAANNQKRPWVAACFAPTRSTDRIHDLCRHVNTDWLEPPWPF